MALTDAEKSRVRRYLGFPDTNRLLHHGLEGALVAVSTEGEAEVQDLLTQLDEVSTQLRESWARQKVMKAEDVVLAGHDEILALRHEGRRLVNQLAALLDVQPRRDAFSSGSTTGEAGRG